MGKQERTVRIFEYSDNIHPEYMKALVRQATCVSRGKVLEADISFVGKTCGIATLIKLPGSNKKVFGVVYEIPMRRLQALVRQKIKYFKTKIVKLKVYLEDGSKTTALSVICEPGFPIREKVPSADYYARMAEGYAYFNLNKRRLDKAVVRIPISDFFQPKKAGR